LLLRTPDGKGRMAVTRFCSRRPGLPNVIREGNTPMINSIIQSGKGLGMQGMDEVLYALAKDGKVSAEDAFHKATTKQRFEALLATSP
jgi:twitching motility protein PilT